jgi:hypothetical protein
VFLNSQQGCLRRVGGYNLKAFFGQEQGHNPQKIRRILHAEDRSLTSRQLNRGLTIHSVDLSQCGLCHLAPRGAGLARN